MATNKIGLDYFPFDVDFFDDDKILFTSARFGIKGENIAIRLLCKIYSEGYFYRFGEDEALLFAKRVGDNCQYSFVNDVVHELVKRGFFNKSIFDRFKILTSSGIQKRYFEASERRKKVEIYEQLLLIDVEKFKNVYIIKQNVYIIDENGNIIKQKKGEESKGEEKPSYEGKGKDEDLEEKKREQAVKLAAEKSAALTRKKEFYNSLIPFIERYSKEMVRSFYDYWSEMNKRETKMKFEIESTWELEKRLATWSRNEFKFNKNAAKSEEKTKVAYVEQ